MLRSACFLGKRGRITVPIVKKLRRLQNTTASGAVLFLVRKGPLGHCHLRRLRFCYQRALFDGARKKWGLLETRIRWGSNALNERVAENSLRKLPVENVDSRSPNSGFSKESLSKRFDFQGPLKIQNLPPFQFSEI